MESFMVQSECFYFVNPGELHSISAETAERYWEDAVVFSPNILGLDSSDEVQLRLIKPIQNGKLLFRAAQYFYGHYARFRTEN